MDDPIMVPALDPTTLRAIDTPAVVVDLDRLETAIAVMASSMAARGIALRPHAKTHKSVAIGRLQLAAGAAGLTVGTIGEAEVFATAGMTDLFIAYPLVPSGPKAERLREVARTCGGRLRVGLDSIAGARAITAALVDPDSTGTQRVEVLVEIDSGGRRTGVRPSDAGRVAAAASELGLDVIGVFTHAGHGYAGPSARMAAADDEVRDLAMAAESLRAHGIAPRVISAGSTPTAVASARGVVTEERPGTYVLGDRQQVALGSVGPDAVAAFVATTVVSVDAEARRFVVDAGAKILAKDTAGYLEGHAAIPALGAVISRVYDYHGVVEQPPGRPMPAIGDVLAVIPNHICPVVNLVDEMTTVRAGRVVGRWPVDARGRNA